MPTNKENKYYVYEWYNIDSKEVFYVGKGNGKRYKTVDGRNQYFQNYYNKHNCEVRKVKINLLEEDAYKLEIETIAKYKAIGQCVCNFHKGGEGGASNKNLPKDTYVLKTVSSYINRSRKMVGCEDRAVYIPLGVKEERSVTHGLQNHGIYTSEQYYDLDREHKLKIAESVMSLMDEEDYNDEVYGLVEDGAYLSFDDYWEQNS